MTGEIAGETKDEIDETRDPADDKPAFMTAVPVAMLFSADCALTAAEFSAKLDMRYEGKRKTADMIMANETKKRNTTKNLARYSAFNALTVFGGRRAWYMVLI
jgi:hypothetical protein